MLLGCSLELGEGSRQEQVEEGEQLDLRGRVAVVLEQENYLVGGVCQALLGPVPGEVELCLSPEGVSAQSILFLMFHAGLPGGKKEYKRDDLVKLHEALLSYSQGFSYRALWILRQIL